MKTRIPFKTLIALLFAGACLLLSLSSCAGQPRAMEKAIADSIPSMFNAPQQAPQQSPAFNAFFQGGAQ